MSNSNKVSSSSNHNFCDDEIKKLLSGGCYHALFSKLFESTEGCSCLEALNKQSSQRGYNFSEALKDLAYGTNSEGIPYEVATGKNNKGGKIHFVSDLSDRTSLNFLQSIELIGGSHSLSIVKVANRINGLVSLSIIDESTSGSHVLNIVASVVPQDKRIVVHNATGNLITLARFAEAVAVSGVTVTLGVNVAGLVFSKNNVFDDDVLKEWLRDGSAFGEPIIDELQVQRTGKYLEISIINSKLAISLHRTQDMIEQALSDIASHCID